MFFFYESVRLITFELGIRFFTDYLEGNVYFKVEHPKQNLNRSMVQFRLLESIRNQKKEIVQTIHQFEHYADR